MTENDLRIANALMDDFIAYREARLAGASLHELEAMKRRSAHRLDNADDVDETLKYIDVHKVAARYPETIARWEREENA